MDTVNELHALIGVARALPPMSETHDVAGVTVDTPALPAVEATGDRQEVGGDGRRSKSPASRLPPPASVGRGELGSYFESLRSSWDILTPTQLELVKMRVAGKNNAAIAKETGRTVGSVSVTVNLARRRLEAARQGGASAPRVRKPARDDDEPEPRAAVLFDVEPGEPGEPKQKRKKNDDSPVGDLYQYFRSLRAHRVLTREEERDLAVAYIKARDACSRFYSDGPRPLTREEDRELAGVFSLRDKLVQANLRYVVAKALKYKSEKRNLIDLIQEGNLGLLHAVDKFDPERNLRFLTYAQHWINAYMMNYIMKSRRLVRLGTTQEQRTLFWALRKTRARLEREGKDATPEEIGKELDVSASSVEEMISRLGPSEVTTERTNNEDGTMSSDWLPATSDEQDEAIEREEQIAQVREAVEDLKKTLNPRMVEIVEKRLLAEEPVILDDLARSFGVSRERIRQLEARIFDRLRQRLEKAA